MMRTRRTAIASVAVASTLAVAACGSGEEGGSAPESSSSTQAMSGETEAQATSDSSGSTGTSDDLDVLFKAIGTAEKTYGGTAHAVDAQDSDGTWKVHVAVDERSVPVRVTASADEKEIVGTGSKESLGTEVTEGLDAASVTIEDAIRTAVDEVHGTLDEAEIDRKEGSFVWAVSIDGTDGDHDTEVLVDVTSGDVVSVEDE